MDTFNCFFYLFSLFFFWLNPIDHLRAVAMEPARRRHGSIQLGTSTRLAFSPLCFNPINTHHTNWAWTPSINRVCLFCLFILFRLTPQSTTCAPLQWRHPTRCRASGCPFLILSTLTTSCACADVISSDSTQLP